MKTKEAVDNNQQTRACQQLFASVIATAINDTCAEPLKPAKGEKTPLLRVETATAFRFIFDDSVSGIDGYALWLDFNVTQFRRKLLEMMADDSPLIIAGKSPQMRRNFRYNYKLWRKLSTMGVQLEPDTDEEEEDDRLGRRTVAIKFTR